MSAAVAPAPKASAPSRRGLVVSIALGAVVLAAIAFDTTVVKIGSEADVRKQVFSPDEFGAEQFPRIQSFVDERAVAAATLGPAVLEDKAAAAGQYGTASSTGAIMPIRLTGTVGEGKSGVYTLTVEGIPPEIRVRVQTGPAINGTDLRDAPGDIEFGNFKNQIEYQDAGSGINRAMKASVLDALDTKDLTGKTIDVVGVFRLINPKNWLITPTRMTVE